MKLEYIIKNLIQNNKIKTQSELTVILEKKGVITTQSNISRILKKLNTVKMVDEDSNTYYVIRHKPLDIHDKIKTLVLNIENNGSVIIVRTYSGAAPLIGQIIDERNINKVSSTISGDNCVMVIPDNLKNIEEVCSLIRNIFLNENR